MNKSKLQLVYVRPVTNGSDKKNYEYDFLFSETPEVVWGVDWTDNAPNLCGDISPYARTQLKNIIRNDLGIPEENQEWI